jgi:cellulase/cellobiase CelA1
MPSPPPPAWIPRPRRRLRWAFASLVVLLLTFLAGVVYAGSTRNVAGADPGTTPTHTRTHSPSPSPTIGCTVTYAITASLGGEFGVDVTIENTGPLKIDGWTLAFDLPEDQKLRFGWAGRWEQHDQTVTAKDLVYNGSLEPGKSTKIGFAGTHGGNAKPKRFTVNGVRCITAS